MVQTLHICNTLQNNKYLKAGRLSRFLTFTVIISSTCSLHKNRLLIPQSTPLLCHSWKMLSTLLLNGGYTLSLLLMYSWLGPMDSFVHLSKQDDDCDCGCRIRLWCSTFTSRHGTYSVTTSEHLSSPL